MSIPPRQAPAAAQGKHTRARHAGRAAVLVIAALAAGCKGEAAVQADAVRPVKVQVVAAAPAARTLTYSGVVRARIESAMGFRVAGKIVNRTVNVGDRVEVGQIIARLDDTDLKLAERSARANVASARARRDVASDNLERAKVLLPKAIISQAAYDTRRNEFEAAQSALESAEAQLLQAENSVSYASLKADRAGIVTAVASEPGQVVSSGQPVITVADARETEIEIAVPEQDAGRIASGQSAAVTLWAGPGESIEGNIREIAGQADASSRTYAVRVAVGEPPPAMRLGMTATVAIRIDQPADAIMVPLTALAAADGVTVVFVLDPDSRTVRRTPVVVAGTTGDSIRIGSGLKPGDAVVTAGVQFLRDGMRVRLPGEGRQAGSGKSS